MSSESPWPKHGLAGKIHAAQSHRPEDVDTDDLQVLTVGYLAWEENREVTDVWREVRHDLSEMGEYR